MKKFFMVIMSLVCLGLSVCFGGCDMERNSVPSSASPAITDMLITSFETQYPQAGTARIVHYYGQYKSGAIVAMMDGSNLLYTQACRTVTIAGSTIEYNEGNSIRVLYNGEFCSLDTAYENGYLTKEDIKDIAEKHREIYPFMYE